jgi:hypothetical protein
VKYLVAVDFDRDIALYSRTYWARVALEPGKHTLIDEASYRPSLAFAAAVDELARSEELVGRHGELRVIRLRAEEARK